MEAQISDWKDILSIEHFACIKSTQDALYFHTTNKMVRYFLYLIRSNTSYTKLSNKESPLLLCITHKKCLQRCLHRK